MRQMNCMTRSRMAAPFTDRDVPDGPLVLNDVKQCPPDVELWEWVNANVPAEAVLTINRFNYPLPSEFFPQQVDVFPGFERAFADEEGFFKRYYARYHEAIRKYRDQPFFNTRETDEERMAFLDSVGATYVLLDPALYDRLEPIFSRMPGLERLYAKNGWAVYAVRRASL